MPLRNKTVGYHGPTDYVSGSPKPWGLARSEYALSKHSPSPTNLKATSSETATLGYNQQDFSNKAGEMQVTRIVADRKRGGHQKVRSHSVAPQSFRPSNTGKELCTELRVINSCGFQTAPCHIAKKDEGRQILQSESFTGETQVTSPATRRTENGPQVPESCHSATCTRQDLRQAHLLVPTVVKPRNDNLSNPLYPIFRGHLEGSRASSGRQQVSRTNKGENRCRTKKGLQSCLIGSAIRQARPATPKTAHPALGKCEDTLGLWSKLRTIGSVEEIDTHALEFTVPDSNFTKIFVEEILTKSLKLTSFEIKAAESSVAITGHPFFPNPVNNWVPLPGYSTSAGRGARSAIGKIGIGIETEFLLKARRSRDRRWKLDEFTEVVAMEHNFCVKDHHPRMINDVTNDLQNTRFDRWALTFDGSMSTTMEPCK